MEIRVDADVSGCILKIEDDKAGSLKLIEVLGRVQVERFRRSIGAY